MDTWGVGTFDNDDAADWLAELQATDDEADLQATFEAADDSEGYLEAPEGARILCACELIAALTGVPSACPRSVSGFRRTEF